MYIYIYQESVRNDQIFYRSISCAQNVTHKFKVYIHTLLVSMNDNKTVEANGLRALHSRSC